MNVIKIRKLILKIISEPKTKHKKTDKFNAFVTFQANLKLVPSICKGVLGSHRQINSLYVYEMRLCWALGKKEII